MTDMANNPLELGDRVLLPFLRGTIYPHIGIIIALRWDYDENGDERQRAKIVFDNDRERWYYTDSLVKANF